MSRGPPPLPTLIISGKKLEMRDFVRILLLFTLRNSGGSFTEEYKHPYMSLGTHIETYNEERGGVPAYSNHI